MKIAIGCDPNAENEKQALMKFIEDKGLGEGEDFGSTDPIYANVAIKVGEAVASKEFDRGILLCGTGLGVSIAANKVKGIRCALCSEPVSAKLTREHNNANMLAFGARLIGTVMAEAIVDAFVETPFSFAERHVKRIDMISRIENGETIE